MYDFPSAIDILPSSRRASLCANDAEPLSTQTLTQHTCGKMLAQQVPLQYVTIHQPVCTAVWHFAAPTQCSLDSG